MRQPPYIYLIRESSSQKRSLLRHGINAGHRNSKARCHSENSMRLSHTSNAAGRWVTAITVLSVKALRFCKTRRSVSGSSEQVASSNRSTGLLPKTARAMARR